MAVPGNLLLYIELRGAIHNHFIINEYNISEGIMCYGGSNNIFEDVHRFN